MNMERSLFRPIRGESRSNRHRKFKKLLQSLRGRGTSTFEAEISEVPSQCSTSRSSMLLEKATRRTSTECMRIEAKENSTAMEILPDSTDSSDTDCEMDKSMFFLQLMLLSPAYSPSRCTLPTAVDIVREIAVEGNFSVAATNLMLRKLRVLHPELPLDCRTLLKTPRKSIFKTIGSGTYWHIGLTQSIINNVSSIPSDECLRIQLFIDGLSLFKSSREQLWPILCRISDAQSRVFTVGFFSGKGKPINVNDYLSDIISELEDLFSNGICIGSRRCKVLLDCVIADAPARAYIRQVKLHSGFHSCERCTAVGAYRDRKVIFPFYACKMRNDADFRNRRHPKHHIGRSPFEVLDIDMINCFPLDYMHMVCLGFCKRLLNLWRSGPVGNQVRIPNFIFNQINERISGLRECLTKEFPRKCRTIEDINHWKAVEYRQFLLYIGPVALRGLINEEFYDNFLNISVCIYILCSPKMCEYYLEFVRKLLAKTVEQYAALYGVSEVTFNMHSMLHLCDEVKAHGNLDSFSAFPFESYMQKLRAFVRSGNLPASQIYRRLSERDSFFKKNVKEKLASTNSSTSSTIYWGPTLLSDSLPNNAVLVDGLPAVISAVRYDSIRIQRFQSLENWFDKCIPSSHLGIYKCYRILHECKWVSIERVQCKAILFPYNGFFIFYPIQHTYCTKN